MIIARRHRGPGPQRRQQGAVAVLVAFSVVALVLMIGLVLDLGHLYVAKNELQNAADACALSGARELNNLSTAGALERATAAAKTAGNANKVDLQKDWVTIQDAEVTFSATLIPTDFTRAVTSTTKYVRCAPHESAGNLKSFVLWIMWLTGRTHVDLSAVAIASPVAGQSLCAIPIAMCTETPDDEANDYGFVQGKWYSGRLAAGTAAQGNYEWVRFPGQQGGRDLADILAGQGMCDVGPDKVDAEPGVTTGVAQAWNTRFGLYSGRYNGDDHLNLYPPDRSGFAYTRYAYKGPPGSDILGSWFRPLLPPPQPPENAYDDFVKDNGVRATNAPYNPMALQKRNGTPQNLPGSPSPLLDGHEGGQDRRLVYVPVIACESWKPNKKNIDVLDYACAFMLAPVDDPGTDVQLEFRDLKGRSDCGSTGFPGGSGAPVPALVK